MSFANSQPQNQGPPDLSQLESNQPKNSQEAKAESPQ